MAILERRVQQVKEGEWDAYMEREKKFEAMEQKLGGFPTKKHYRAISGPYAINTVVWEREWESFAAMEAANEKLQAHPDRAALRASPSPIAPERVEFYLPLD